MTNKIFISLYRVVEIICILVIVSISIQIFNLTIRINSYEENLENVTNNFIEIAKEQQAIIAKSYDKNIMIEDKIDRIQKNYENIISMSNNEIDKIKKSSQEIQSDLNTVNLIKHYHRFQYELIKNNYNLSTMHFDKVEEILSNNTVNLNKTSIKCLQNQLDSFSKLNFIKHKEINQDIILLQNLISKKINKESDNVVEQLKSKNNFNKIFDLIKVRRYSGNISYSSLDNNLTEQEFEIIFMQAKNAYASNEFIYFKKALDEILLKSELFDNYNEIKLLVEDILNKFVNYTSFTKNSCLNSE